MQYVPIILSVALIHLLGVMSPGPDFIMILRNSLLHGRKSGLFAAIGLGLGILVHVTYCLLGVALIISRSILIFSIIKYIGAAYLLYIGVKSLRAKPSTLTEVSEIVKAQLSPMQSIRAGFLTNVTNPKVTLFFLSIFTLVIKPGTPLWARLVMGGEMCIATMLWFSLIAVIVSHRALRAKVAQFQHYAERIMGGVLILFGLKLGSEHLK